jgi:hypothetical protein
MSTLMMLTLTPAQARSYRDALEVAGTLVLGAMSPPPSARAARQRRQAIHAERADLLTVAQELRSLHSLLPEPPADAPDPSQPDLFADSRPGATDARQ